MNPIFPRENLSRFVLQKKWIRNSDNTIRHLAFMPNPRNGETSVFRTSGINDNEIWEIGEREVAAKQEKPILGRADIIANNVIQQGLTVIPVEPPARHANIVGWPEEESLIKQIALELAETAALHLKL